MHLTSSWCLDFVILCTMALFLLYTYLVRNFNYWKKRGVYCPKPIPFFGNFLKSSMFKMTIPQVLQAFWNTTEDPYFGVFVFDEPALVLKSPELIKDVLIKDFAVFSDKRIATYPNPDMQSAIFFLNSYGIWKKTRTKLTPFFTSAMLKTMHAHLDHINKLMTTFLEDKVGIIDCRSIGENFSTEMIGRCFFGIESHCFDSDDTSLFKKYAEKVFTSDIRNALRQILYFVKPALVSLLRINFLETDIVDFFKNSFIDATTARLTYNGKPQNLVDLTNKGFTEIQNGDTSVLDQKTAISNCILFVIAGRDTSSMIINVTLYELALNQNIQDTLRKAVEENFKKYQGFTYDGIQDNKYLKMCINESFRKYPPLPFLDRVAVSDYRFKNTNLTIQKGLSVLIPVFALHRDEHLFPDAEKFDPERFSEDKMSTINASGLNFIPFGEGPRQCIGQRLGILAVAMAVSNIILRFKLEKCDATPKKMQFETKTFTLLPKFEIPLKVTRILEHS